MQSLFSSHDEFIITIEVVPPGGNDPEQLLKKLGRFTIKKQLKKFMLPPRI